MEGQIGAVGKYDVKFEEFKLKVGVEIGGAPVMIAVLDKVKDLIPGHFDDAVIEEAKALILKAYEGEAKV